MKLINVCILYPITEAIDGQTSITIAPMEFSELNSQSCPPHSVRSPGAARVPFYCEPGIYH